MHERTNADAVRLGATELWRIQTDGRLDRIERFIFWTMVSALGGLCSMVIGLIAVVFSMMRGG